MRKLTLGLTFMLVLALALALLPACGDKGAEFELSGLNISPSEAGIGETVTIRATVENVGEDEGDTEVTLTVEGDEVDTEEVTVAAGATETVSFTYTTTAAGTYDIEVDGLTGTLTVTAAPPVTYATYTYPVVGYGYEYPNDWRQLPLEEILFGNTPAPEVMAASDVVQYVAGFEAPEAEDGFYPNILSMAYVLPMPFAPRAFYGMLTEPDGLADAFPGFTPITEEDVRTTKQDRVAFLFSFTWTNEAGFDLQMMAIMVSKAGNMYLLGVQTTQETWDKWQNIFRHICMSVTVPE